jgi:hypothetical protein
MKRTGVILGSIFGLIVLLGGFSGAGSAAGGNRCSDHCAERYRLRKDVCKAIPYKHERHACEDAAKRAKDECKHKCN